MTVLYLKPNVGGCSRLLSEFLGKCVCVAQVKWSPRLGTFSMFLCFSDYQVLSTYYSTILDKVAF